MGATLSAIGNKIYLFGGRGGKDMTPLQSVLYSFDTELDRWEVIEAKSGEVPAPRSFHAMTASDSDIYVFGGCPSKVSRDFRSIPGRYVMSISLSIPAENDRYSIHCYCT